MNSIESYIYGLLVTDGNLSLSTRNRGRVILEISEKDEDIIDKLLTLIPNSHKRFRIRNTNFKKGYKCVIFVNYRKEFRDKLICEGFPIENKTINADVPITSYDEPAFWRGVIDGDGSIGIASLNYPFVSLTTKSEKLKENYLKFLYENLGITKKIKRNKRDNVYNIMVTRKDAVKLVNILYENSEIHLNRKYDSAMEVNKWSNNN